MPADRLVHQRLGEGRLVAFVVTEAAIAEHVDDHRLVEGHAELGGNLGCKHHGFWIVAIDVEDRRFDHLRHIRRIRRRTREGRIGGETDLVVDDEMDRTGNAVALQARKAEALGHDALTGKGGIAVQQKRQNLGAGCKRNHVVAGATGQQILLGAGLAHDDRIDDFKVRRVGGQRQVNLVAVELTVRRSAQMVLHVARTFHVVRRIGAALELVEDGAMRLAHDLAEHVQTATVGHAEDDFLDAHGAAALDDLFQRRDQRFTAIEAKTLGALVLDVDELLEAFRFDKLRQDGLLAFRRESNLFVRAFDAFLNPGLFSRIGDMHEFDADRAAIGALQDVEHFRHGRIFEAEHVVDEDLAVVVGRRETVVFGFQLVVIVRLFGETERIEIGVQMAAHAIGADHHDGANAVACSLRDLFAGQRCAGRALRFALCRLALQLVGDVLLDFGPVAIERGNQFAIGGNRPVLSGPGRAFSVLLHIVGIIAQLREEIAPLRIDRIRIVLILGVQLLDIVGIAAIEE